MIASPPTAEPVVVAAPLWSAEIRGFDGDRLHLAILSRGWTVDEFARTARLHPASVYNALRSRRIRDATALRIFETLDRRTPTVLCR